MSPAITLALTTHDRPDLARRALCSALRQTFQGEVEVLVCLDRCGYGDSLLAAAAASERPAAVRALDVSAVAGGGLSGRLGAIRNRAVAVAGAGLIGFLDDDNLLLPDHLASLHAALERTGAGAAHAWRRLLDPRGAPWFADRFPWASPGGPGFEALCRQGVLHPGSDLLRDRAVLRDGSAGMVDTSCWLFRREVLERFPFPEEVAAEEAARRRTEDDLLLAALLRGRVPLVCTHLPTVLYQLGGYSNR